MPSGLRLPPRVGCAAVAVLVVILVLVVAKAAVKRYENYLTGYWVGDPAFLARAHLRDLQLFIAPNEGGRRQGYLIITDENGDFVSNQAIEIRERPSWRSALRASLRAERDAYTARRFEVEYDAAAEGDEPPMPASMKMAISILDGTLTLYDEEKVYAFMEKDLAVSAAALAAYGA
jgi:hypothetical protein